jgi:outer membrane protein assembly factor BamB
LTENVKWKAVIPGRASSSPIVWNDKVFVTTAVSKSGAVQIEQEPAGYLGRRRRPRLQPTEHEFLVLCLSRKDGQTIWSRTATVGTPREAAHGDNTFASASPSTDGKYVIASFGSQGLFCFDFGGELKWARQDLGDMSTRGSFGEGSSPVLHENTIVLPWDHEGNSYIAALDKATGEALWKVERDEATNWATPLVVERAGRVQVVHSGQSRARGYDLATGAELWSYAGLTQRPVASPVSYNGLAFFASSRGGSFLGAVRLDGRGDLNNTDFEAWSLTKGAPDIPSLLLIDERLYFLTANTGVLSCVQAETGKTIAQPKRLGNMRAVYSSPVAAAGRIYVTGRDGQTVVLEDGPQLKILAQNQLDEPVDATAAIAGDELFLRGTQHLFCLRNADRD